MNFSCESSQTESNYASDFLIVSFFTWMPKNRRVGSRVNKPHLGFHRSKRHGRHGDWRIYWALDTAARDTYAAVTGPISLVAVGNQSAPGQHPRGVGSPQ